MEVEDIDIQVGRGRVIYDAEQNTKQKASGEIRSAIGDRKENKEYKLARACPVMARTGLVKNES